MLTVKTYNPNTPAIVLAATIAEALGQNANVELFVSTDAVSVEVFSVKNYNKAVKALHKAMVGIEDAWYDHEDEEYRIVAANGMYASVMKLDWR